MKREICEKEGFGRSPRGKNVLGTFVKDNWDSDVMTSVREFYDPQVAQFHRSLYYAAKECKTVEGIQTRDRVQEMMRLAGGVAGKKVLEIGMGVGLFSAELARRGAKVTGLDFSLSMLNVAKKVAFEEEIKYMALVQAATPHIPFCDSSFDSIILGDVMEHLVPKIVLGTLVECYRLLRSEGSLIVHTAPSRYCQLLIGNRIFRAMSLPVLLVRLPQAFIESWLETIYSLRLKYKRNISKTLRKGELPFDEHGHINCQTAGGVARQMELAGFRVEKCYGKELFLKNKQLFDRRPFSLIPAANRHFLMRSVFAVGVRKTYNLSCQESSSEEQITPFTENSKVS